MDFGRNALSIKHRITYLESFKLYVAAPSLIIARTELPPKPWLVTVAGMQATLPDDGQCKYSVKLCPPRVGAARTKLSSVLSTLEDKH